MSEEETIKSNAELMADAEKIVEKEIKKEKPETKIDDITPPIEERIPVIVEFGQYKARPLSPAIKVLIGSVQNHFQAQNIEGLTEDEIMNFENITDIYTLSIPEITALYVFSIFFPSTRYLYKLSRDPEKYVDEAIEWFSQINNENAQGMMDYVNAIITDFDKEAEISTDDNDEINATYEDNAKKKDGSSL